jgi:intracellular sulfur oxidation DsrE/DsrF family protein
MRKQLASIALIISMFGVAPIHAETQRPDDSHALAGVEVGKVVFDINIPGKAKKMELYMKVIQQTYDDLVKQNVEPDMILAFRGMAVKLVSAKYGEDLPLDEEDAWKNFATMLADLQAKGVRVEACSVATALFGVDHETLLPGVIPVGNTFVSLTGYQAKDYGVIPIY